MGASQRGRFLHLSGNHFMLAKPPQPGMVCEAWSPELIWRHLGSPEGSLLTVSSPPPVSLPSQPCTLICSTLPPVRPHCLPTPCCSDSALHCPHLPGTSRYPSCPWTLPTRPNTQDIACRPSLDHQRPLVSQAHSMFVSGHCHLPAGP